ncbi:hypothetical protein Tco_1482905 [Tanacetum coccineum]
MSTDTKLTKDKEYESIDSTKYQGMIGEMTLEEELRSSDRRGEEEDEEEEEEEEKEELEKKGSKEVLEMGPNSESSGYAASDNEVESDLESTARSEPKCKEMEDTCESGVRPKPDSS